jgi:hypothetical protein
LRHLYCIDPRIPANTKIWPFLLQACFQKQAAACAKFGPQGVMQTRDKPLKAPGKGIAASSR